MHTPFTQACATVARSHISDSRLDVRSPEERVDGQKREIGRISGMKVLEHAEPLLLPCTISCQLFVSIH